MKFSCAICYAGTAAVLLLFSGCDDRDGIKVYRVSKETPSPENSAGMMGATAPPGMSAESAPGIADTAPPGWEPQPLSSMRQASYLVKGDNGAVADVSLVILGGPAGGVLENVNRWLGQIGQPAITDEKLAQMAEKISAPLGEVSVVDLEGLPPAGDPAKDGRILAGIASDGSRTFFFKMRGNAALVAAQKKNFAQWISSVRMAEAGASPLPAAPASSPGAETEKPQIKWEIPAGWKSVPASAMRYASFTAVGSDGAAADISVSVFESDGGGDLGNVNRWCGQIGLQPIDENALKKLVIPSKAKDAELQTVDLKGSQTRILAGWARIDGRSWFFKITGPDAAVACEKEKFAKFLRSVQFRP